MSFAIVAISAVTILIAGIRRVDLAPFWCGVVVAYTAYLRASGVKPVSVVGKRGLTVISLNLSESMAFCLVMRQKPTNNVWALQVA